jgi:hypothetical protein
MSGNGSQVPSNIASVRSVPQAERTNVKGGARTEHDGLPDTRTRFAFLAETSPAGSTFVVQLPLHSSRR